MSVKQENNLSDIFTARLAALMEEGEVTQKTIAESVGVAQATVSGWQNGSVPGGIELYRLAAFFGVAVEDFFRSEDSPLALRDKPERTEADIWKIRAQVAERMLVEVRNSLQSVMDKVSLSTPPPKPMPNLTSPSEAQELALRAAGVKVKHRAK